MCMPNSSPTIAFLGFGEASRAFCASLAAQDKGIGFQAWDRLLDDDPSMKTAMKKHDVKIIRPAEFAKCDWIFSAVTADQSLLAAKDVAPQMRKDQIFVDLNSVSPARKQQTAELIEATGARYIDMAVMAPVHPRGHKTPVLIAGKTAQDFASTLTALEFDARVIGPDAGQATAIKMVRSLFVKGLEAITVECLLAAEASGCGDEISASLAKSFAGLGWPEFGEYEFERTLRHGVRRAAEMREVAATYNELGLHAPLAEAIADIQEKMGQISSTPDNSMAEILAARREAAHAKTT